MRHTDGRKAHEKMLNITNTQGNANQTTERYHLTPVRMAVIKKVINEKCSQECGERESSCIVWGCKMV